MFRSSFKKIPLKEEKKKSDDKADDFPLITALNFMEIDSKDDNLIPTVPITCNTCGSVLANKDDLKTDGDSYKFECIFCRHVNKINKNIGDEYLGKIFVEGDVHEAGAEGPSTPISSTELNFIVDEVKEGKQGALDSMKVDLSASGFPIQSAIIDVSGSMAGGRLNAVKHALEQNIFEIAADFPKSKFVLIPFSSDVMIYPNPSKSEKIENGPIMFKIDKMRKAVEKIFDKNKMVDIEQSYKDWVKIVKNMTDLSMTALGPALYAGIQTIISSQSSKEAKDGGKVLLLTDGLANVGLGSIESDSSPDSKHRAFYNQMAQICVENNIIVDIVAVRDNQGGNSVALDIIGQITNYTGGNMLFITADQIEKAFGDMHKTNYIARNVVVRVFSPDNLILDEIQGAEILQSLSEVKSGDPIRLGAFYPDRELYLKFKPNKKAKKAAKSGEKIPIQIQMEYKDKNNHNKIRVFRQFVEVASDQETFEKAFDPKVATAYELSKASKMRSKGNSQIAMDLAAQTKSRNVMYNSKYDYDVSGLNELVADEMDEWECEEAMAEKEAIQDKKSFMAAQGQSRSRDSFDMKMKRMSRKKKKK
jgi:Sec23/Sec24 zinc finger protein